jgi:molecular chaperone GrpE
VEGLAFHFLTRVGISGILEDMTMSSADEEEVFEEGREEARADTFEQHDVVGDEEIGADNFDAKAAKMREELKVCRAEKQEYMDGWQRSKADYVNLLKRFETESRSAKTAGVVKAVETLLPAFDALERSKEHGEIPEGFTAIAKQLESAFASLGLEEIGVTGEHFDPSIHEALGQDHAETLETDDTITVVLEKGWKLGDTVIRPAKVRVSHFTN